MTAIGVLALATLVAACDDPGEPAGPGGGDADLHGTVATAKTGAGVANALVALVRDGAVVDVTATDAGGEFAFSGIPAGEYVVRLAGLELTGLSLRHTVFTPIEQTVDAGDGSVELFFAAVGVIPARVVGFVRCAGQPVEGARLRVVGGADDTTVVTNAQGKYGATDLAGGWYAALPVDVPCDVVPAYGVVEARAGQTANADFEG